MSNKLIVDHERFKKLKNVAAGLFSMDFENLFDAENNPYDHLEPYGSAAVVDIHCGSETLYMLMDINGYNHGLDAMYSGLFSDFSELEKRLAEERW